MIEHDQKTFKIHPIAKLLLLKTVVWTIPDDIACLKFDTSG